MCRFFRDALTLCLVFGSACLAVDSTETTALSLQLDQVVDAGCTQDGVTLLAICSDAEFLRRIWLDLAGRTPPLIEVKTVAVGSSVNRGEVVQRLLRSPEFARHWGRARIRPLSADQLHLSLGQAFGYHYDENDHRLAVATGEEFTQDIPVNNLGATPLTLARTLSLYNSEYARGAVELGSEAAIRLYGPTVGAEHVERLFMSLLSRRPSTDELEFFQDLGGESDPREGLQDIVWVLLNSTEFITNH